MTCVNYFNEEIEPSWPMKTITILQEFTLASMRQAQETSLALREAFKRGALPLADADMEDLETMLNKHCLYCERKLENLKNEIL